MKLTEFNAVNCKCKLILRNQAYQQFFLVSMETNIISLGLTMLWLLFSGMKC